MTIRLRGESITNLLPGGALIGEPMKAVLLVGSTTMTRAEAATSFLLSKFVVIMGHVAYVVAGLALSYTIIDAASERVFGIAHFATLALGAALAISLLLITLLAAAVWFRPAARWLVLRSREGGWRSRWNRGVAAIHRVEELLAAAARKERWRIVLALVLSAVAWGLNALEAYVVIRWIGAEAGLSSIFAIDAVSSVVRMILFVIPIGIGGQDWTISGLMMIYGIPDPVVTAANIAVVKRLREFLVAGIGLVLLAAMPRRSALLREIPHNGAPSLQEEGPVR
jgi:uncharacterized membrane protein YbhN (UPF0104 family)